MQIRCLLEGIEVEEMLENWGDLLSHYMGKWGLSRTEVRKDSI